MQGAALRLHVTEASVNKNSKHGDGFQDVALLKHAWRYAFLSVVVMMFLIGFLLGTVAGVALAGLPRSLLGNGDSKPSTNGARPEKSRWWLR